MLTKVRKGKRPSPRKVLIYGTAGIGKSTWWSMAPNVIGLDCEDGLADVDCESIACECYADVLESLDDLYRSQHQYENVAIDTADWLEAAIFQQVCDEAGVDAISDIGFGAGYTKSVSLWQHVLKQLDRLHKDRRMGVFLIAHSQVQRFNDPSSEPYDRYSPRLDKRSMPILMEWSTEILFATYKTFVTQEEQGFGKSRSRAVGDERIIYTTETASRLAKNRLTLPVEMPLDYREFAKYLPVKPNASAAVSETAEQETPEEVEVF